MSRKKHTHQTKAEAHADEVAVAATAAPAESPPPEGATEAGKGAPHGRLKKLVKSAEELARTRLSGTRVELLVDGLPERWEKLLDAALDRVGLVRKSKLPGAESAAAKAGPGATPAPAE